MGFGPSDARTNLSTLLGVINLSTLLGVIGVNLRDQFWGAGETPYSSPLYQCQAQLHHFQFRIHTTHTQILMTIECGFKMKQQPQP